MTASSTKMLLMGLLLLAGIASLANCESPASSLSLKVVADVPLPGRATRMDYISVDPSAHRVYLAHMGDGSVISVDTAHRRVVAVGKGMPLVRGVLAVPELGRVYAAAAGSGDIVDLQASTLKFLDRIRAGNVDGLDYDPSVHSLFVTDQHGGNDVVIDVKSDKVLEKIPVGGEVGNTIYDAASGRILVAVGSTNELVTIDPKSMTVSGRYPLPGVKGAHGIAIDPSTRTAFIAGEDNSVVCSFSLTENKLKAVAPVGRDVDVLDVDPGTHRLFVASESGVVSIFNVADGGLMKLAQGYFARDAHVVGVDRVTHLLYFPLEDVGGKPVLRICQYTGP